MCDLWPLLCSSERFSTRWFYFGGASSWKVHSLNPRPTHGCDVTLEIKIIYTCTIQMYIHRTMFVVPCICTQCVFHGNKSNFNAGICVILTIFSTNLELSQISPQRMYQFDCVIFMINSFRSHSILPPSLINPFIPLINHRFIFIYKICICFIFFICLTLLT